MEKWKLKYRSLSISLLMLISSFSYITACQQHVAENFGGSHVLGVASEDFAKVDAVKLGESGNTKHVSALLSGNVSVYGEWYYQDRIGRLKPVRYAMVQLWADDLPSDVYLATIYTQSDGYYEFPAIPNNNGSLTDGYDIYVKLLCDSYQYSIVRVGPSTNDPRNPFGGVCWSQTGTQYNVTDGGHNMGRWLVTGSKRECWAAYDGVADGYFWLLNQVDWHRSKIAVAIQDSGGESYSTGNGIVFSTGAAWERDTVLHEYGHCINYVTRGGSSAPSANTSEHYPDSEITQTGAFREGWADFFACAVDNYTGMWGGYYGSVETTVFADGPFGHGDFGDWDGDVVEGAVAQVFWDIFDGESLDDYPWWSEPYGDHISNEFGKLWSILLTYRSDNIHDFWAHWNSKDARIWAIFQHARILEPRNIATTDVSPSQQSIVLGETIHINITVRNQGDTVENHNLTIYADDLVIDSFENVTLESGSSEIFTVSWNTTGVAKGDHTISARAITFPKDPNATDDANVRVVTIFSSGHDVGISGIVPSKTVIGQKYSLPVDIMVRNYGIFPEAFNVTISANSTIIGTFFNVSLTSGCSSLLTLNWDTTAFSAGNYAINIYIAPIEGEVDTSDNTLVYETIKVTIPGDVNGDFLVNNSDADQIRLYWQQNSPPALANVDINGDDIINIKDAALIGLHWQERYPPQQDACTYRSFPL